MNNGGETTKTRQNRDSQKADEKDGRLGASVLSDVVKSVFRVSS